MCTVALSIGTVIGLLMIGVTFGVLAMAVFIGGRR